MFKMISISLLFTNIYSQYVQGDIMPPLVGNQRDNNNCLISAGYSWCEDSQSCIRQWITPCQDNFNNCDDCLSRQSNGENIACPVECNNYKIPEVQTPLPSPPSSSPPMPPPPIHLCPEVMCMMYCENGFIQDKNGCNMCSCNDPMIVVDPLPLIDTSNICSQLQNSIIHECNSDCHNCDFNDANTVLGNCLNSDGRVAKDNLCQGEIPSCSIPYHDCDSEFVCPKITEVTSCGENGLSGYSTYRLSLIIKNPIVQNIYAIYGDDEHSLKPMIIPPAYQSIINFNSNIGGVLPAIINIDSDAQYDSWLTIGLTDGNSNNEVMTVGIDFSTWSETSGIHTTNGAVFTMNPEINIVDGNEYIIAQITIPNDRSTEVTLNAQGRKECNSNCNKDNRSWMQEGIVFNIIPPTPNNQNNIPTNCISWYDGCNTCQVNNGQIGACTRMMCFREDNPYCLSFQTPGH
jgi:hypothetical protein